MIPPPSPPPCRRLLLVLAATVAAGYHQCRPASSLLLVAPPPIVVRPASSPRPSGASGMPTRSRWWSGGPPPRLLGTLTAAADNARSDDGGDGGDDSIIGTVALLVPSSPSASSKFGTRSPVLHPPSYLEVAEQLVRKIKHFSDGRVVARVVNAPDPSSSSSSSSSGGGDDRDDRDDPDGDDEFCLSSDALFAVGLTSPSDIRYLSRKFRERRESRRTMCQFAIDCGAHAYAPVVGPYDAANDDASPTAMIASMLSPWSDVSSGRRLSSQMSRLFGEMSTDEFALATMLYFDRFSGGRRIPWVMHSIDVTWEKGPYRNAREVYDMVTKCGSCISKCLSDENCSSCIRALDKIDTRDQVSSYRTLVSYESELLRDFSLCILTKNNVFGCDAEIPKLPVVRPMATWRGGEVTSDIARSIMIGHLRGVGGGAGSPVGSRQLDVSWKVACGANAAYDQFPSQNQLFYPAARGTDLWYDPVFRVETIDGRDVWCKRHYRVRRGAVPGTFRFSVLDNGVTSDEFWTVLGAADDLGWVAFHYAGAAAAVGQRYIGGLLCTPDGGLPPPGDLDEIWSLFRSAEIEPWELFVVDNDGASPGALAAGPPPLDYYRKTAAAVG